MKNFVSSLKKLVFAAFLPFFVTACGDSPGGTGDPADNTPPVTTADPAGGTYSGSQSIALTCTDSSGGGCWKTFYTSGDGVWRDYGVAPITATAASGAITLEFYSIDNSNNAENMQTELYAIE